MLRNYAHSHWQQRSSATPSLHGYMRAKGKNPTTPETSTVSSVTNPYRTAAKKKLMANCPGVSPECFYFSYGPMDSIIFKIICVSILIAFFASIIY